MNSTPSPKKIRINQRIRLDQYQSWSADFHVFDEESAFAIEMALATGRPLLVRGEPGIGKSQLARAAAQELNRCFVAEVINLTVEGQDLLWQYDPVARLNDAQVLAAETAVSKAVRREHLMDQATEKERNTSAEVEKSSELSQTDSAGKKRTARYKRKKKSSRQRRNLQKIVGTVGGSLEDKLRDPLHPGNYISPGVLWWVFDSESARRQYQQCRYPFYQPRFNLRSPGKSSSRRSANFSSDNLEQTAEQGFVLLIDEIDKADPSLPNSLLEVLGNGGFHVPLLNESVGMRTGQKKPLVIITTNEERELPPAFVRRCLVLNLQLDDEQSLRTWWTRQSEKYPTAYRADQFSLDRALVRWLAERGEVHFSNVFSNRVRETAAEILVRDRQEASQYGMVRPGQAEYLDLLRALREMSDPENNAELDQLALLEKISPYALIKSPPE